MVRLYFNDYWYDLTDYVDLGSVSTKQAGDGTISSASFTMGSVPQVFTGLDVSRPLPRNARVDLNGVMMIVSTDTVVDVGGEWSHEVELVDTLNLTMNYTNSGLTVSQPPEDVGLYYRSFSLNTGETINDNAKTEITFTTTEQSIDTTDIEDRTMKKTKKYMINFTGRFFTDEWWLSLDTPNYYNLQVTIEIGGVVYHEQKFNIYMKTLGLDFARPYKDFTVNHSFEYENDGTNEVKVYVKALDIPQQSGWKYDFNDAKITISATEYPATEQIMLDYVVDKLLSNDANEPLFVLDENSRGYLKGFVSYEWTFPESYLFLQLQRIANYIKAYITARFDEVEVRKWVFLKSTDQVEDYDMTISTSGFLTQSAFMKRVNRYSPSYPDGFILMISDPSTNWYAMISGKMEEKVVISLLPYNPQEETPVGVHFSGSQATIDDYASARELNAKNVYSSDNDITDLTSIRASGGVRLIEIEDLIFPTTERIGEVVRAKIRVPSAITVGSITKAEGDWIDIDPDRILRQEYYNTLPSLSDYSGAGRFGFSKNNCLYFIEGERDVLGLSYLGETEKSLLDTGDYLRGVYEVLIAQLVRDNGNPSYSTSHKGYDTGAISQDNKIAIEITYRPYTETNAVVLKSDQSGFAFPTIKYLNENMAINNPDVLGSYTQAIADRSGGTIHTFVGECKKDELPSMFSSWNGMVLFGIATTPTNSWEDVEYTLQYIKDFVFVSAYESGDATEEIYTIPVNAVQDRVIKKNILLEVDTENLPSDYNITNFITHLVGGTTNARPKYAVLNHDEKLSTLPVVSQALGRVVEFRVSMKDNYSAGLNKSLNGSDTYQQDVGYTDVFGRVSQTSVAFYQERTAPTIDSINALPKLTTQTFTGLVGEFSVNERKDARERSVYSLQYAYLSQKNGIIIIYDGIGKYANVVAPIPKDIKWVEVNELPHRQAVKIDRATIVRDAVATRTDGKITITTIGTNAVVCYDDRSDEILMVDARKTLTRNLYFRGMNRWIMT